MIDGFIYDDSATLQSTVLRILRRLDLVAVQGFEKLRVGRDTDGGYVMLNDFKGLLGAYSIGINDDISWDAQIAAMGLEVFQYDHTINSLPETNARFHWKKLGLAPSADEQKQVDTLSNIMIANGHDKSDDLLLKIDIEGTEWDVFSTIDVEYLKSFRQIIGEFHGFQLMTDQAFADKIDKTFQNLSKYHRLIHVHANNNSAYSIVGGVPIPATLELSFIRADNKILVPSFESFPTPLDRPCWPGRADYVLGAFRF